MPQPVRFAVVKKMFVDAGWVFARVKGSHHQFKKEGHGVFTVPVHRGKVSPLYVRQSQDVIRREAKEDGEQDEGDQA
jgi:predicted RNA binding protein YcfA (HicA-like mRNA interferase family)